MRYLKSFESSTNKEFLTKMSSFFCVDERIIDLLISRGIDTQEKLEKFFNPAANKLYDPFIFKNMQAIVDKIKLHIAKKSKILIFGDYDVDGITATAMMIKFFREFGIEVSYFIPNRYEDGYGLTMDMASKVLNEFAPDFVITVDCGITSVAEVDFLKQNNVDVLITDHHEPNGHLPDCLILNAKLDKNYPNMNLCGAGVVLKIIQAFNIPIEKYLAMCMVATISDIVELLDENRIIVASGLKNYTLLPKGILEMMIENDVCDKKGSKVIKASDIAFKIVPKLNASGRMNDAFASLSLYLTENDNEIKQLIKKIINYNLERQKLCNKVYDDVKEYLCTQNIFDIKAIVCSSAEWNVGILGIVAARIAEEFNRPTFLFAQTGDELVGSARSVNGVNIHNMLSTMGDIIEKFGGHIMAAGLTLKVKNYDLFISKCEEYIAVNFKNNDLVPTRFYDFEISHTEIASAFVQSINRLEPCGHNNQAPIFLMSVGDSVITPMKNHFEHLILKFKNYSLLAFNSLDYYFVLTNNRSTKILTELSLETYKDKTRISGVVKSIDYDDVYRPADEDIVYAQYLKQLTYISNEKCNFHTYSREQLIRIILEMKQDVHGVLFIANDYNSYINFKAIYDSANIVQNRIFEIIDQSGLNTILLGAKNFNYFNTFNKIVFLDPIINLGYLVELQKYTKAQIFLPKKSNVKYSIFNKIKIDRAVFGKYFRIFEFLSDTKTSAIGEYELYKLALKNMDIHDVNFLQFMACLYVFVELGIIEQINQNGVFLKVKKGKQTTLDLSTIYNKYKVFQL